MPHREYVAGSTLVISASGHLQLTEGVPHERELRLAHRRWTIRMFSRRGPACVGTVNTAADEIFLRTNLLFESPRASFQARCHKVYRIVALHLFGVNPTYQPRLHGAVAVAAPATS